MLLPLFDVVVLCTVFRIRSHQNLLLFLWFGISSANTNTSFFADLKLPRTKHHLDLRSFAISDMIMNSDVKNSRPFVTNIKLKLFANIHVEVKMNLPIESLKPSSGRKFNKTINDVGTTIFLSSPVPFRLPGIKLLAILLTSSILVENIYSS